MICKIGPFTVYSYGLMLVTAFLIACRLAMQEAKRQHQDPEAIFNLAFTVFVFGVIGSRIFYVVHHLIYYLKNPAEIIMLQRGGLSWFGGLVLGGISGILYSKKKKLPIYRTLDLIAPYLALGQSIGRIGCLLNGCCFGRTLVPTQLYSSLALIVIFIILRTLQGKPHLAGKIFFAYLFLYSIKRFFIEFWRADNAVIFFGLTLFQLISIALFCVASLKLLSIKKTKTTEAR